MYRLKFYGMDAIQRNAEHTFWSPTPANTGNKLYVNYSLMFNSRNADLIGYFKLFHCH